MFIRDLKDCSEITAGDATILRELLHGDEDKLKLHYSLAHAILKPGQASKPHSLKSSEVYYILAGEGIMYINEESTPVYSDQAIYIPPDARQYIMNSGKNDLKFLCLVDPAWHPVDEQIL